MFLFRIRPFKNILYISEATNLNKCTKSLHSQTIVIPEFGDPGKVLRLENLQLDPVGEDEVVVHTLLAPINPADINTIQGVYRIKPKLPAIAGNEGLLRVEEIGPKVTKFAVGDWVVPTFSGFGTWRSRAIATEVELMKIPSDISPISAATMSVNPCTAYRMLKGFESLVDGDIVIQTGANSAVGQAVIQIASELRLRTVNIVRNRPNFESVKQELLAMGASYVFADDTKDELKATLEKLPQPRLGLDCVAGRAGMELLRYLAPRTTLVVYGGMSMKPLSVPVGSLIFNNIRIRGFWMTRWRDVHGESEENDRMWSFLCAMARKGTLVPPAHNLTPAKDFQSAVVKSMQPFTSEKQILTFDAL